MSFRKLLFIQAIVLAFAFIAHPENSGADYDPKENINCLLFGTQEDAFAGTQRCLDMTRGKYLDGYAMAACNHIAHSVVDIVYYVEDVGRMRYREVPYQTRYSQTRIRKKEKLTDSEKESLELAFQCIQNSVGKSYGRRLVDTCTEIGNQSSVRSEIDCLFKNGESRSLEKQTVEKIETSSKKRLSIPARPEMVEIRKKDGFLVGGISELTDDSRIYISASHVLEGNTEKELRRSFANAGLVLDGYQFCHATRKSTGLPGDISGEEELDVVIAVPDGKLHEVFDEDVDAMRCSESDSQKHWKLKPAFASSVDLGDRYFSYMYGALGTEKKESFKVACGVVNEVQAFGTFSIAPLGSQKAETDGCPKGMGEDTSPTIRGSGAVVYTKKPKSNLIDWKVGGILACEYPTTQTKDALSVPGKLEVISMPELQQRASFTCGPVSEAIRVRPRPKDCVPIDGRGSGG